MIPSRKCWINLSGKLNIVSTPIGNLNDISQRALNILNQVDYIACEDTRITKKLLNHYKIQGKLIIYNDVNEVRMVNKIINYLKDDFDIALVSDAGTPCISDPGYRLINKSHLENIEVISIPGPCSLIASLSISGLPTDTFYYQGFLPRKKGRKTKFELLREIQSTVIIFESPKRLNRTLNDIYEYMGNRIISLCKEITKLYENVKVDEIINFINEYKDKDNIKGEYIIIIAKEGYKI